MNILSRRIGIWFHESSWANDMFYKILNNIPEDAIEMNCVLTNQLKLIGLQTQ